MGVRERKIETALTDAVRVRGGQCYKWSGTTGAPDRIVLTKAGVWFVEVKTVDGRLSAQQKRFHQSLGALAPVYTVYGYEDLLIFLKELDNAIAAATTA